MQDPVVENQAVSRRHRLHGGWCQGVYHGVGRPQHRRRDLGLRLIQQVIAVQPRPLEVVRQPVGAARHFGRTGSERDIRQCQQHVHGVRRPLLSRLVGRVDVPVLCGRAGTRKHDPQNDGLAAGPSTARTNGSHGNSGAVEPWAPQIGSRFCSRIGTSNLPGDAGPVRGSRSCCRYRSAACRALPSREQPARASPR